MRIILMREFLMCLRIVACNYWLAAFLEQAAKLINVSST